LLPFDNLYSTNTILEKFVNQEDIDLNNIMAISPDHGAISRTRYYADVLGCDIGIFIKRRDCTKVVDGSNPILEHQYIGESVKGKSVLVIDDIIASGNSMLDVAEKLKKKGAKKIYLIATFALFAVGVENFNKAYKKGLFHKLYTTNATYVPDSIKKEPWFEQVDMAPYMGRVINAMNLGDSISPLICHKRVAIVKEPTK
jgi:ribose-phosphate pyrophosphokinase